MQAAKRNFRIQPGNPLWRGLLAELSAQSRGSSWLPARRLCLPGWNSGLLKSRENKESSEGGGVSCRQLASVPHRNVSCFCLELWVIVAIGLAMSSLLLLLSRFSRVRLCPTLCDSMDGSPPGSPVPGILQARTKEWVAISFSNALKWKVKVNSLSRVWLVSTPWTAAYQALRSMGFSRQEYWSGVPSPSLNVIPVNGYFSSCCAVRELQESVSEQLSGNCLIFLTTDPEHEEIIC